MRLKYGLQNRMLGAEFLGKAGPQRRSRAPHDLSAAGLITPSKGMGEIDA